MAYQRTEYNREEDRDNNKGGWRSWFGLENKDRDEDRDYHQSTTTYRNDRPFGQQYERNVQISGDRGDRSYAAGYAGARGGYGYQTADVSSNRYDSSSRPQDRDVSYRAETRTYGGEQSRPYAAGGDFTSSRYGFSGDRDNQGRNYGSSADQSAVRSTGFMTSPDYEKREFSQRPGQGFGGDRDQSRSYGASTGDRDYQSRSYAISGERDNQSRSYGFSGENSSSRPQYGGEFSASTTRQQYGETSYPRSGYQSQSYSARY